MAESIDHTEILHRLKNAVSGRIPVDPTLLASEATLADIGIDSFSLIELIFVVEEEFKIIIPLETSPVSTVHDILNAIALRIRERNQGLDSAK